MTALGDVMVTRGGSLNPAEFPDEEFELYSIPAHDRGGPEAAVGSEIGSSKQIVQPGDVMISKIIPHIRRARVVGPRQGKRQIASGEWIVFRGDSFDGNFLRHFLLSDGFHRQFMNTVAGVGGSLVRARPAQVKAIELPLQSLPEQRRIAAILDHADALRSKRPQVLAHLDSLTQSIFYDTFGDPHRCPKKRLDSLIDDNDRVNYGVVQPGEETPGGIPLVRVSDLVAGVIDRTRLKRISRDVEAAYTRSRLRGTEILVSSVGSIGVVSVAGHDDIGSNIARAITRIPISDSTLRTYVASYLQTPTPQRYFVAELRTVAQPTLNVGQLAATQIPVPPKELQVTFAHRLHKVQTTLAGVMRASANDMTLFASLQSRAFRGDL